MKYKKLIPILLAATLVLGSCGNTDDSGNSSGSSGSSSNSNSSENSSLAGEAVKVDFSQTDEDMFTDRDSRITYDESESVRIELNGTSASCNSNAVEISGSTITIKDEGTYIFSGTLDDGMIIVNAEEADKPQIVLDNVTINSETSAPIYILEADKVFITLAEGSTNTLSNGGTFTAIDENNIDAVIYSKQDLTINGNGTLDISSPSGHGIVGKDDLVFTSGTYTITSSGHGLDINDSLRVKDASITIASGKDGAHVENSDDNEKGFIYISSGTFDIDAEGDGLDSGAYVQINDGTFDIVAGGGYENGSQSSSDNWGNFGGGMGGPGGGRRGGRGMSSFGSYEASEMSTSASSGIGSSSNSSEDGSTSMKGIKSTNSMLINGGTFTIDSADDSVHSNISVYINGGTFAIASGDDAIHGEEELTITNGTIDISTSYEGLEALDITISGGSISIQSSDDGINAAGGTDSSGTTGGRDAMFGGGGMGGGMSSNSNGSIVIEGGKIFMYAEGDGIDANGSVEITGGYTVVTGPTNGDTAILDYDNSGTISGGTFIGIGAISMAQTFSGGTQGVMALQASGNSGTEIRLEDAKGNEIVSYTPDTSFQCIIISTPDMESGESYTVYVGSQSGTFEAQ